jgi:dihydropteroate synthase
MKKNKISNFNITTKKTSEVINVMFSRLNVKERERILNMIDHFIMTELNVSKKDIPWLNAKKSNMEGITHFLDLMRLGYAKLLDHSEKNFIKKIH